MKYIELDSKDSIPASYATEPDASDIQDNYNIDIQLSDDTNNENLEKKLSENYNKQIALNNSDKDDITNLNDIFRQLKRFMYSVQNIKYKLSIFYKNYLCSITKDDELDCFSIMNFPVKDERKLYVYIDLKTLYTKMENVVDDIKILKHSIYKILDQNQLKHSKILNDLMEQKNTILECSSIIFNKKENFDKYISEFESLLLKINESEKILLDKVYSIKNKINDYGLKGLQDDIEKSHLISKYEAELSELNKTKKEIIHNILNIKSQKENITLKMDKILFDNAVMINEISKNFSRLAEIL